MPAIPQGYEDAEVVLPPERMPFPAEKVRPAPPEPDESSQPSSEAAAPSFDVPEGYEDAEVEIPREKQGAWESFTRGLEKGVSGAAESGEYFTRKIFGKPDEGGSEQEPADAESIKPSEALAHPIEKGIPWLSYQTGRAAPAMIGAGLTGGAGALGIMAGSGLGAFLTEFAPQYRELLSEGKSEDEALKQALKSAGVSGVGTGLSFGAFGLPGGFLKQLLIQPSIGMSETMLQNYIAGRSATEGIGEAAIGAELGLVIPMAGHYMANRIHAKETNPKPPQSDVVTGRGDGAPKPSGGEPPNEGSGGVGSDTRYAKDKTEPTGDIADRATQAVREGKVEVDVAPSIGPNAEQSVVLRDLGAPAGEKPPITVRPETAVPPEQLQQDSRLNVPPAARPPVENVQEELTKQRAPGRAKVQEIIDRQKAARGEGPGAPQVKESRVASPEAIREMRDDIPGDYETTRPAAEPTTERTQPAVPSVEAPVLPERRPTTEGTAPAPSPELLKQVASQAGSSKAAFALAEARARRLAREAKEAPKVALPEPPPVSRETPPTTRPSAEVPEPAPMKVTPRVAKARKVSMSKEEELAALKDELARREGAETKTEEPTQVSEARAEVPAGYEKAEVVLPERKPRVLADLTKESIPDKSIARNLRAMEKEEAPKRVHAGKEAQEEKVRQTETAEKIFERHAKDREAAQFPQNEGDYVKLKSRLAQIMEDVKTHNIDLKKVSESTHDNLAYLRSVKDIHELLSKAKPKNRETRVADFLAGERAAHEGDFSVLRETRKTEGDIAMNKRTGGDIEAAEREQARTGWERFDDEVAEIGARQMAFDENGIPILETKLKVTGSKGVDMEVSHKSSLGEMLDKYNSNKGLISKLTVFVRKALKKHVGDVPVYVVSGKDMKAGGPAHDTAGYYSPKHHHIVVNERALGNFEEMSRVVLHEGIHAATVHAINAHKQVRAAFETLMEDLSPKLKEGSEYAFKNPYEFVTEALSTPEFHHKLATTDLSPDVAKTFSERLGAKITSGWDAIVGIVRDLLGVPKGATNALEAVMLATSKAMDVNAKAREFVHGKQAEMGVRKGDAEPHESKFTDWLKGKNIDRAVDETAHKLVTLRTKNAMDRSELWDRLKKEPSKRVLNEADQKTIYEAIERGTTNQLPAGLRDFYDRTIKPVADENRMLYRWLTSKGHGTATPDPNYIHRMAEGHQYALGDVDMSDPMSGYVRNLKRKASPTEGRKYFAIEDSQGQRHVIAESATGFDVWNNKNPTTHNTGVEIKPGEQVTYNGRQWEIKQALTSEIEQHTHSKYYKSALLSVFHANEQLRTAARNVEILEDLKSHQFYGRGTTDAKLAQRNGWEESKLKDLRGWYFEPDMKAAFDDFAKPGLEGMDWLRKVNNVALRSVFWTPVPHAGNVLVHVFGGRGFTNLNPWRNLTYTTDLVKSLKSVVTQDKLQRDLLNHGAAIILPGVLHRNFTKNVGKLVGIDVPSQYSKWSKIANVMGLGLPKLIGAWYEGMNRILWGFGDVFATARVLELERMGKNRTDAIAETFAHIPDYRVPVKILGSRSISQLIQSPQYVAFGRYHYNLFNSLAHIMRGVAFGSAKQKYDAIGQAFAFATMGWVIYPLMNQMWATLTGNKDAEQRPRGPIAPIKHGIEMMKGEEGYEKGVQGMLTMQPIAKALLELWANRDFAGRPIIEYKSSKERQLGQLAEYGVTAAISPYNLWKNATKPGGPGLLEEIINTGVLDIKVPTEDQKRTKSRLEKRAISSEKSRSKKPRGPIEELINRL